MTKKRKWRSQIGIFLDRDSKSIGHLCGGKRKLTGEIDVAMIQSLLAKTLWKTLLQNMGRQSSMNAITCQPFRLSGFCQR